MLYHFYSHFFGFALLFCFLWLSVSVAFENVCLCVYQCPGMETRWWPWVSFSITVRVIVSETVSLPEAVSHHLNRLTDGELHGSPCLSLLIPLSHLQGFRVHYHTLVLYVGLGEPKSSFYACVASTLQTGQSLISVFCILLF